MADFTAKQLDSALVWNDTLTYSNNTPVNLTGATVNLVVRTFDSPAPLFNSAATVVTPAAGTVSYSPTAANTAIAGNYMGNWIVTFSGGSVETFPTVGYLEIVIEQNLTTLGLQTIVSLEEVKEHLNILPTDRTHDAKILSWIYGMVSAIENYVGPVIPKTYNEWRDGNGQFEIVPWHRPITQLLACSFYIGPQEYQATIVGNPAAGTIYSVMLDPDPPFARRITRRGPGGGLIPFPAGIDAVHIVYEAGQYAVTANVKLAIKELLKLHYQPSQQANRRARGANSDEFLPSVPVGYLLPGKVKDILAADRRFPSLA